MIRTNEGLLLERLLHDMKYRYALCWNGEINDAAYDCACCITWPDNELYSRCGCICHERIEAMVHNNSMRGFLRTYRDLGQFPKIAESRKEAVKLKQWHYHGKGKDKKLITSPSWSCEECRMK